MNKIALVLIFILISIKIVAQSICPTTISVGTNCSGHSCISSSIQVVDFDTYTANVLTNEWGQWGAWTNGMQSLNAGAVAIRSYAINRINNPIAAHSGYNICNTEYCHVYKQSTNPSTYAISAVSNTSNFIIANNSGNAQLAEYAAETNDNCVPIQTSGNYCGQCGDGKFQRSVLGPPINSGGCYPTSGIDPVCVGRPNEGHPRGMCQRGTIRWATGYTVPNNSNIGSPHTHGTKSWQQMIAYYYPYWTLASCSTQTATPPLCNNDNPCSPRSLTINTSGTCNNTDCSTINATPTTPNIPFLGGSSCNSSYQSGRYDDDVWFTITPSNSNPVTIRVTPTSNLSNFDPAVGLYQGSCSNLTQVTCADVGGVGVTENLVFTPTAGVTYYIRVFSYGIGSSYSGNFQICAFSSGGTTCNTPGNTNESGISQTSATLSWGNVPGAQNYSYRYRKSGSSTWTTNTTTNASVVISGLDCGDTYQWEVRAQCSSGNSSYSSTRTFSTVACPTTCNTPSGTTESNTTQTSTILSWNIVSGVLSFDYRYRVSGTSTWTTGNTTFSSANITGLTCNTTYEWQVRAVCSGSNSSYSSTRTFSTVACPTTCNTPSGTTESNTTQTSTILSWNIVSGVLSFDYRYRVSGTSTWTTGNTTFSSANITGLTCNTTYEWQVRAVCSGSNSSYSSTRTFNTLACPPNPCNNITPINGCGPAYSQTFIGTNSGSWFTDTENPCNYVSPGNEKIYSFVAPTTGTYSIQVTSTNSAFVDYFWKSGSCSQSGWTCIEDIFSPGVYDSMQWTAGNTYYILLDNEYFGSINGNHTFYITCTSCSPPATPPNPTSNSPQCGNVTITRSGTPPAGTTWYWQGTSCGTSTSNAASTYTATESGTYYIRAYNTAEGCWSANCGSITVTSNPAPSAVTVSGGGTFCGSSTLTASGGSGGTIYWQGTTNNGTSTATPSSSQTVTTSGTYYFRARSSAGCWGPQGSATVTINAVPSAVTVSGGGIFCGSSTLTASGGSGGTIYWQGTTNNGTSTATPSSSQTVTTSGTYYFRARSSAGCWGPQGSATVTINAVPSAVTVSGGGTFCGSATLTASGGSGGTIFWQGTTSNGTSMATVASSQTVTSSGTYYFRAWNSAGCWGPQGSATVTINPNPTANAGPNKTYSGTAVSIGGSPTGAGGTPPLGYSWSPSTGLSSSTAANPTVSGISSNTTYTVTVTDSKGCSATSSVIVSVQAAVYTITLVASPVEGGTVSGGGTYSHGSSATVIATPNTGYTFANWTENGTVVSSNASYSFTVTGSRVLVANFTPITHTINLVSSPTAGGVLSGGGTYPHGTIITVNATPNPGYQFINWTQGGAVLTTLPFYSFTVNGSRTLHANFALSTNVRETAINKIAALFPNPTNGMLYLQVVSQKRNDFVVQIIDMLGRKLETRQVSNTKGTIELSFDMGGYPPGNYILHLFDEEGMANIQFSVQ